MVERYVSTFLDCIHEAGGDMSGTVGDGVMAVFQPSPPLFQNNPPRSHARLAADTALALLAASDGLSAAHPHQALDIHIGLNSGPAMVGATRFEGRRGTRWIFTASGPVTNLAVRLSSLAQKGQILLGPETAQQLGEAYRLQKLSSAQPRDVAAAIDIYSLLGLSQ